MPSDQKESSTSWRPPAQETGHLHPVGKIPGRGAGHPAQEPRRRGAPKVDRGRNRDPAAEERGPGPVLRSNAGGGASSLLQPGNRSGGGHRGADRLGERDAGGQRARRITGAHRRGAGLLRRAQDYGQARLSSKEVGASAGARSNCGGGHRGRDQLISRFRGSGQKGCQNPTVRRRASTGYQAFMAEGRWPADVGNRFRERRKP